MLHRRPKSSRSARRDAIELENDVRRLAYSIAEIAAALRTAEAEIEADARGRIGRLREEAREQLAVLYGRYQNAMRLVSHLVMATEDSRGEIPEAAHRTVKEACTVANAMVARLRRAVPNRGAACCDPEARRRRR